MATTGLTVGELRARLPPGTALGGVDDSFMVDVRAVPVIEGSDTLYHLLFSEGFTVSDTTHLEMVATLHGSFRTAEGVGPGVTLAAASSAYGAPTLSYSVNDESREYASFAGYPAARVRFRVAPAGDARAFAGVYDSEQEHNETATFDPEARISMVIVELRRQGGG